VITTPRRISVTINGPEGMLEAMAKTLEQEGYTVLAPDTPSAFQRGRVEVLEGLMRETIHLWHEWSTTDITADDDRWVAFTDRAHAWLAKARVAVPDRTPKAPPAPPAMPKRARKKRSRR
jgi:hypothetical protein